MISQSEALQIRKLLQSQEWQTAQRLAEEIIKKIQDSSSVQASEWETLRTVCNKEGQIQGIRNFINNLYEQAGQ